MTLVEFSFVPDGNGGRSGAHVDRVMRMIERSGLRCTMGPNGPCLQGDWEEVSRLLGRALKELSRDVDRISLTVNVHYGPRSESTDEAVTPARILGRMPALVP